MAKSSVHIREKDHRNNRELCCRSLLPSVAEVIWWQQVVLPKSENGNTTATLSATQKKDVVELKLT